ncbi:8-oxo-dGDP phosphatase NUDT18 isoform X2 [Ochotona princeps]|uniref:8-oxo-dGDP phosphatase NUDT18 isoform X2 n=1 Tax=Ochotona princeps TaxID=9978 RepID=UPI002714E4EB|nr:8-oxo-dGDP phosphatase NUDT18 isoform X2 [Ochotona princeps]
MASEDLTRALAAVLGGRGLQVQNWDSGPAGGKPPPPARLRANVSYVVLAVFLNEKDEVLLIQEAKRGILKTSKEADAESLQAGWFPRTSLATPLRAHDTVHLLELAAQYLQQAWHPPLLPQELPCSVVCQRLIAVFIGVQTLWVLVGTVGTPHLPVTVCDFTPAEQRGGLKVAVLRLLQECLTLHTLTVEPKGVLGLQHLGRDGSDGICLDVLVAVAFHSAGVRAEEPPKVRGENYAWWKVADEDLQSQLRQRLRDCSVVPLNR